MQFGNIQTQGDVSVDAIEAGGDATIDKSISIQIPPAVQEAIKTLPTEKQDEVSRAIEELQKQINSKKPDESLIKQLLRKIRNVAPDILEVVTITFTNPLAGIGLAVSKLLGDE